MIYSINYIDMAGKINSLAFVRYLKETGWNQFSVKRTSIKVFQFEKDNIFEQVTIPMDNSLRDFNNAMFDAVKTVALVEKKSFEQVMLYLLNPNSDIIKIRLDNRNIESGNILFDDAIRLYDNAKKLLAATALDIINPKRYHYGRTDDVVQKFLSECRFGQTEIGSYVVSVVCPFADLSEKDEYKQLSIFSDEEQCANSLTRKVTNKLMENIHTIKTKIDDDDIDGLIEQSEDNIISGNFYEALNGLNLNPENTTIEFTADWAPTVKSNRYNHSKFKLTNDYYQPIIATIEKLKIKSNKSTQIVGRIKKLESLPAVDLRKTGNVTISYIDDEGKQRVAVTKLEKNDYDLAIEAHKLGKYVQVIGDLNQGKRSTINSSSFSIIE